MDLPFKHPFKHNIYTRKNSESILVRLEAEGFVGWGEGLPRSYVTGETQDLSIQYIINELRPLLKNCYNPKMIFSVFNYTPKEENNIYYGAAYCAVETALLDIFTKKEGIPIHSLIDTNKKSKVNYSGVLGAGSRYQTIKTLLKFKLYGFKNIKVKNIKDIKLVKKILGPKCIVTVDANCSWEFNEGLNICAELRKNNIAAIEEPFKKNTPQTICGLQSMINIPIIVDETLCSYQDAKELIYQGFKGIFNLRLSKCGGLTQCIKIFKLAKHHGIKCKLGCHPGESSILSALGRHLAVSYPFKYIEGSYGKHLLVDDLALKSLMFGYKGIGKRIDKPGLGIEISEEKVARYCRKIYQQEL